MKVLMFGWEFPPYFAGGVGTVCEQLTKALSQKNIDITFVMPKGPDTVKSDHVKLLVADNLIANSRIKFRPISSTLKAYQSIDEYEASITQGLLSIKGSDGGKLYGENLLSEIQKFALKARIIAQQEDFDVIHAHDWTTFPAAIQAAEVSGKSLITHMHITEFDKTGGTGADPRVYAIEKEGMDKSDIVIAVSNKVKHRLMHQYFIPEEKIKVVYNGAEFYSRAEGFTHELRGQDDIVLFAGRVTLQKGPDYFVEVARKVLDIKPNTKFILAGSGDMLQSCIKRVAELGMTNKFLFPGFFTREEGDRMFQLADLFILPSVSEPFGIVPLEAMYNNTPAIISKQAGCSEVLTNCLKADFWDVEDMAAKTVAALSYKKLNGYLRETGKREILSLGWEKPADQCINIYNSAVSKKYGGVAW